MRRSLPISRSAIAATPRRWEKWLRDVFLQVLCDGEPVQYKEGSGRAQLAQAIASESNPLTARVIVNRIWQYHFGKGIVRTPSNFGRMGERPDASGIARLSRSGLRCERMEYQEAASQDSALRARTGRPRQPNPEADPDNKLLSHFDLAAPARHGDTARLRARGFRPALTEPSAARRSRSPTTTSGARCI